MNTESIDHSSSSLSLPYNLSFFLFSLPALAPPNGEVLEKSIYFSESTLTKNEATLTIYLPTLICLCLIKTLA